MQIRHESQYLGDRNDLPPTSGSIHDIPVSDKKLAWCLRTIAVVLAVAQTWKSRYIIFSDGISYLDIAEAYQQQDWMNAINSYWSPLYSWVLAAFSAVLSPDPAWSVPMLHAVNFLSFLCSLAAFEYFLRCLARYTPIVPSRMSAILGYCLVLWSGLTRITIDYVSPDILVTAFIFCISGVLLQLRARQVTSATFILLGFLLGVAYLTKGIFFLLAIAFYIPASLLSLNVYAARKSALVLVAFLVTCAPFVTALSVRKGRLTFGETGRLNYAWEVLGAPRSTHWQGEPENLGAPTHPTIQVLDSPAAYVFAEPIAGTYPPWYDPSYWYDGISPRFDLRRQVDVLKKNLYYSLIQVSTAPGAIILLILVLGNVVPRWLAKHAVSRYWFLLLPSAGAVVSYCLVFVDRRYISGFLVVFFMAIWAAVYERIGHLRWPAVAVVFSAVIFAGASLLRGGRGRHFGFARRDC